MPTAFVANRRDNSVVAVVCECVVVVVVVVVAIAVVVDVCVVGVAVVVAVSVGVVAAVAVAVAVATDYDQHCSLKTVKTVMTNSLMTTVTISLHYDDHVMKTLPIKHKPKPNQYEYY
jgi:hypothetical protein